MCFAWSSTQVHVELFYFRGLFWDLMTFSLLLDHLSSSAAPVVCFSAEITSLSQETCCFVCVSRWWVALLPRSRLSASLFVSVSLVSTAVSGCSYTETGLWSCEVKAGLWRQVMRGADGLGNQAVQSDLPPWSPSVSTILACDERQRDGFWKNCVTCRSIIIVIVKGRVTIKMDTKW